MQKSVGKGARGLGGGGGREYGVSVVGEGKCVGVWESVWGECGGCYKKCGEVCWGVWRCEERDRRVCGGVGRGKERRGEVCWGVGRGERRCEELLKMR